MNVRKQYWFPAKRYGWGWGVPGTWQGWAVLAVFFAALPAGALLFHPAESPLGFAAWSAVLSLALVLVCYLKGEPPRWRWGGRL